MTDGLCCKKATKSGGKKFIRESFPKLTCKLLDGVHMAVPFFRFTEMYVKFKKVYKILFGK